LNNISILIIEDNAGDERYIKQLLKDFRSLSCNVTSVKNLESAKKELGGKIYDAILLDLNLPDSTGIDTIININEKKGIAPVLVLSGMEDEAIKKAVLKVGAQNFIDKNGLTAAFLEKAIMYSIEREKNVQEILRIKNMLGDIIASSPVMMFVVNSKGEMVRANPAADEIISGAAAEDAKLTGDLLGCINSFKSGGCGRSRECEECGLRKVITECVEHGVSARKKEIEYTVVRDGAEQKKYLVVSANRLGETENSDVLISIDDRTEERTALAQRIESENKYRQLFTSIGQAFALHKAEYTGQDRKFDYSFVEVNGKFEEMTGLKAENIIGRRIREVIPSVEEYWMEAYEKVVNTGVSLQIENYSAPLKKYYSVYVFRPMEGQFAALINDITDRKVMEERLAKQANSIKSALNIMQKNPDTVKEMLDYALEEALALTGSQFGYIYYYNEYTQEFTLNTWSKQVMSECHVANPQTRYQLEKTGIWGEAVRQRKPIIVNDFKAQNPLKKGYPKGHAELYNFMTIPVFAGNEIVAVVGVANKSTDYNEDDVSQLQLMINSLWVTVEHKQANEQLKKTEEKWQKFINSVRDVFMILDEDFNLVAANTAAMHDYEIITGKELKTGINLKEIGEEIGLPFDGAGLKEALSGGNSYHSDFQHLKSGDGISFYYNVDILSIGTGFGIMMSDVTELKRSEAVLKQSYEKINQLNTMKSNFISVASHELRTPLTVIKGFSSFLKKGIGGSLSAQQQEYVSIIDNNAMRLTRIINDIMDMSKMERGKLEVFPEKADLKAVLAESVESLRYMASEKGVSLGFKADIDSALAEIDTGRITQVINNLINNAVRFTKPEGTVDIMLSLKNSSELRPMAAIKMAEDEKWYLVTVSDTGEGIDKKHLKSIFDLFYQVENPDIRKHQGTGLGLSIAKTIIEKHGGDIWAESEGAGKGAAFNFIIPAIKQA